MQPTGIQPAQLLMEVMASAKDKIGENISRSAFSQQLYEQHQLAQNVSFGPSATTMLQRPDPTSSSATALKQPSSAQPSVDSTKLPVADVTTSSAVKGSALAAATTKNLVVSKWKTSQELTFTDSMALEKVLAQYHLSPSVTTAIRDALGEQDQISLQKLNQILDRASASASEVAPEGKATAEEIQSLLAAVLQQGQLPAQSIKDLVSQIKGPCDFNEFRELLRRTVDQVVKANVKPSGKSSLSTSSETDVATAKTASNTVSSSRAKLPNQTESLTANLIPSFLRDDRRPSDDPTSPLPAVAATVPVASKGTTTEAVTVNAIGGGEASLESLQSVGQSNVTVNKGGSGDTQSAQTWSARVEELPYALQELLSRIVLNTPGEATPGHSIEAEAVLKGGSPVITSTSYGIARQVDANTDPAITDQENALPSAASSLANASITGAAAFWAMRSAPTDTDPILEGMAVDQTISARPSIPVVEKIAASATASFASADQGSSGSRDFLSNGSSTLAQQDAQSTAGTIVKPLHPNHLTEGSTGYPDRTSSDATGLRVAAATTESSAASTVPEPSKGEAPRTLFRDVIRLQTTTRTDVTSTEAPMPESVTTQISAETPSALYRPQATITPDSAGTDAPLPEYLTTQISAETPSALNRLQATITPDSAGTDAPLPEYLTTQISAEIPAPSAHADSSPIQATIGKTPSAPTAPTGDTTMDASLNSSSPISPRSIPTQQEATSVRPTTTEDASMNAPAEMVPAPDTSSDRPAMATMRRHDTPWNALSGFQTDAQTSSTFESSVATHYAEPSLTGTAPAGATSPTSSAERNIDLAGLTAGSSKEQLQKRPGSDLRSAGNQREPVSGLAPLQEEDLTPPSQTGKAVSPQATGSTFEDPIPVSSNPAVRDSRPADAELPARIVSPGTDEESTNAQTIVSQAAFPEESRPSFHNSVELLAKGAVDSEATAGKNTPVAPEVSERTTRQTSLETGSSEVSTEMKGEKTVAVAQTYEQSPRQEQGREHTPTWFRNDVQMVNLTATPSTGQAAEMFSSFTSSLTAELAQRIQELHRQKRDELTLELQPEHLGRLRLRIGTDDNQVTALISTESEQIKDLLGKSSAMLRQELASQGLVLEKLQIDVNSQATTQEQSFSKQGSGSRRNGANHQGVSTEKGLAAPAGRRTQIGSTDTLINLFV